MGKKDKAGNDGYTDRQKNIARLRAKLNKPDPDAIKVFTKYKVITYGCNIICPPYSLYRIWRNGSPFTVNEKMIQSGMCGIFLLAIISAFIGGGL